ncbi:MAG: hypothetical protein HQL57_01110 [Magnetococcales bacterium]|nr:hypothetical protein [Magnetococcales bacterium]MBF0155770.1 hypothetical protein [Magnetococcales bacterium]
MRVVAVLFLMAIAISAIVHTGLFVWRSFTPPKPGTTPPLEGRAKLPWFLTRWGRLLLVVFAILTLIVAAERLKETSKPITSDYTPLPAPPPFTERSSAHSR